MDNQMIDMMKTAVEKATKELNHASYLSESGANAGIRKMNDNKVEWLRWVVYLAQKGLEDEMRMTEPTEEEDQDGGWTPSCEECLVNTESKKLLAVKDEAIEELNEKLNASQLIHNFETEYRKSLINRALIEYCTKASKAAHDNCWLDGTVLVTPVEYLDKTLLELIKE